ncbi:MAG: hypothetical protein HY984_00480 [Candidatus Magasanikbacteria bacterium]|nr:hypothetical protein [Candidatus Magasanikbacteria bacterium]
MKKLVGFAASFGLAGSLALPAVTLAATGAGSLTANDLGVNAIQSTVSLGSGDIRQTAARIINVALGFLGIIAVIIVLIGGFKYMISGGEDQKVTEAKQLIISGIIGLAIILSAWAITSFVISRLLTATTEG